MHIGPDLLHKLPPTLQQDISPSDGQPLYVHQAYKSSAAVWRPYGQGKACMGSARHGWYAGWLIKTAAEGCQTASGLRNTQARCSHPARSSRARQSTQTQCYPRKHAWYHLNSKKSTCSLPTRALLSVRSCARLLLSMSCTACMACCCWGASCSCPCTQPHASGACLHSRHACMTLDASKGL